ncbi:MAG TPA: molybdate ABC transporter substrate-binding protein [Casimicrobiaceae bacterium]|nr:molybdate ABC transporter substrate-binding protein [Casimicrobiaceae bacterium]
MLAAKPIVVGLAAIVLAVLSVTHALAADVLVFGAASLKEALDEQAKRFAESTGDKVTVSYAASSALARQIANGAPADLFISADLDWMDYLDERKLLRPNTRIELLRNALVLIAPAASGTKLAIRPGFPLAEALGRERLAMADPDIVPAGKYGRRALERLGVWSSVEQRVARAENVRAVLALVSRGEAPFGIVYATDARADKGARIVDTFPADSHPAIVYPAAIVAASASPAAKPLLDYLQSAAARPVWERYGFRMAR